MGRVRTTAGIVGRYCERIAGKDPRLVSRRVSWWRVACLVVAGYLAVLAINRSLVKVHGGSMDPTLWHGDHLLTVPSPPWPLRRGQVVVLRDPMDPSHLVIKRLTHLGPAGAEVHGDAPDHSTDSRQWGPIPVHTIRRVALARWPDLRTPLRRRLDDRVTTGAGDGPEDAGAG